MSSRVIIINLNGGLGGIFQSPKKKIEAVIDQETKEGWSLKFVLPPNFNPCFIFKMTFFAIITLFIYVPTPSYMIIFEKK